MRFESRRRRKLRLSPAVHHFRIFVPNRTQFSKIEQKLRFLLKIGRILAGARRTSGTSFDGGMRADGGT
jgi:hypothetical protein